MIVVVVLSLSGNVFATKNNTVSVEKNLLERQIYQEQRKELRKIWNNYPAELEVSNFSRSDLKRFPRYVDSGFTGIGFKGDILIALDSWTDHVGMVMDKYTIIEAHPDNPNGGVDYRDNNWKARYRRIKGLYVKGASYRECRDAVDYCMDQIGEPYNIFTGRWSEDEWYCSKLVWRAWYNQGYDIEGRRYEPRGTHVTPGDILDSSLTKVFYSN